MEYTNPDVLTERFLGDTECQRFFILDSFKQWVYLGETSASTFKGKDEYIYLWRCLRIIYLHVECCYLNKLKVFLPFQCDR